jgi:hypothetical protein
MYARNPVPGLDKTRLSTPANFDAVSVGAYGPSASAKNAGT